MRGIESRNGIFGLKLIYHDTKGGIFNIGKYSYFGF